MASPDDPQPALDTTVEGAPLELFAPGVGPDLDRDGIPGYEIESRIGSGACGVVYRARQLALGRSVALKSLSPLSASTGNHLARFEKEAVALAKLQHPHIVGVFDSGQHRGRFYFAMELLDGCDLERRIRESGALGEAAAWSIARQTAVALDHAYRLNIVHRDIKPANLFLVEPPNGFPLPPGIPFVKITDFGLALDSATVGQPDANRLTQTGTVVGTPYYMAPEQFHGAEIDCRADIYALGATVFHMLCGVAPFAGNSIWEVMLKKTAAKPPSLGPGFSRASDELVGAMLQPDPNRRIGSYRELIAAIDALGTGLPAPSFRKRPHRRIPIPAIAAVAAICGLVAIPVFSLWLAPGRSAVPSATADRFVSTGTSRALFNGRDLQNWNIAGGQWSIELDPTEGGAILAGKGVIRAGFEPKAPFRLAVGLRLPEATAEVEIPFCKSQEANGEEGLYSAKVQSGGAQLGKKIGANGPWQPLGEIAPYPTPEQRGDSTPYLPLEIENLGDRWVVRFNSETLGSIPAAGTTDLREVRIAAAKGKIHIESVAYEELRKLESP